MYIVKNDQPDVPWEITPPIVTDAEGEEIAATEMIFNTTSTDPAVVQMTLPDPADMLHGIAHFGQSGVASVNVQVLRRDNGALLGSFGAQFTVTKGDPASIVGGAIVFTGIAEV